MIKNFRGNYLLQLVFLAIIVILLWLPAILSSAPILQNEHYAPLYDLLLQICSSPFLALILVAGGGLLLNHIFVQNELIAKTTFFQAILYVMLMSCSPSMLYLTPVICANIFLLLAIRSILEAYDAPDTLGKFFISSFFIAIASFFYFPAILFWIWVLIAFFVHKAYTWRTFFVSLLGLLAPFIFLFTVFFLTDSLSENWTAIQQEITTMPFLKVPWQHLDITCLIWTIFMFFAVLFFFYTVHTNVISFRKKSSLIAWYMLPAVLSFFFVDNSTVGLTLLAPSVSFFCTTFFFQKRKPIILNLTALILLLITLINVYWPLLF